MKEEYCCIWCHNTGSTVCERDRGLAIGLTTWNKQCPRNHKAALFPTTIAEVETAEADLANLPPLPGLPTAEAILEQIEQGRI